MSATDPRRVEEIFDGAIEREGAERARWLDEACGADAALRQEVDALLASDRRAEAVASTIMDDARRPAGPPTRAPSVVGRFEIVQKLGEGGMGVVYEAYDARLDRKVALKLVRVGHAGGSARARLLREAQAMAKLAHPNVVPVYEVGEHEDQVFVAMELVPGETLSSWLAREPREWREVLAKLVLAGNGLAAAHAKGIVHRDFKPDNVLVGADGRPRVVDFGLARAIDDAARDEQGPAAPRGALRLDLTAVGTIMGTPAFMSPEHFRGEAVGPAGDQFGFAVALYRALFGAPPFEGDTVLALRDAVCAGAVRAPPDGDVPHGVVAAVMRALSVAPQDRFPRIDDMLAELEKPLRVDPELDPARARRGRRVAAIILTVFALATLAGIPFFEDLGMTPRGILVHGAFGLAAVAVIGVVFKKTVFATTHNRRIGIAFAAPVAGFVLHRAIALRMGTPIEETLAADAISAGVVSLIAGVVLERWMAIGAALSIAYLALVLAMPRWAGPAFGTYILTFAAGAAWWWGEPRRRRSKKTRDGVSGSSPGSRTTP